MKKTAMLLITLVMVLCSALAVAAGSNAFPQPVVQAPSSVQRGEYFTVSIGEVAGVINYDLNIIDTHGSDNEDDWEWLLHTDEDGYPGTLTLSTATLAPGDYTWLAGLAGTQTREGNRTTGTFSVTASPRVGLHVSRTDMLSYENFWGNIVAPGAEGVKFYVNGNEWDSRDGEVFDATWLSFETEGDYVLGASACFGGEWTDPADTTVTVHLSSPHGDLGDPHFEIPGEIAAGTDLVIPYEAEDGTDVFFWYETLEGEWQGDGNGVDGQIVVSGLEEGGLYRIHLTAAREGYNGFVQAPSFIVNYAEEVRVDDAGSTLTMRLARGESYAFDVGGLHTTVYAPGADEVKLLYLTDEGTWEERDWFISDAWGEGYRTEIHW
ncbi:MAG: hypothetical protein IJ083_02775, partial [Clostridia bacterium]|nr:hypothetical protein [Clostridia bacterium]